MNEQATKIDASVITQGEDMAQSPEELAEARFFAELEIPSDPVEQASLAPGWLDSRLDTLLARIAEIDGELAQNEVAKNSRLEMVRDHFDGEAYSLGRSRKFLEGKIQMIALSYPFPGGKKSRKLPSGSFGFKKTPERVRVLDKGKAEGWAAEHHPNAIEEVPATTKLVARTLSESVIERIHATGEVPDPEETGVAHEEAKERGSFFVKTVTK